MLNEPTCEGSRRKLCKIWEYSTKAGVDFDREIGLFNNSASGVGFSKGSGFAFSFDFEYKESVRESRTRMSSSKIATKEYVLLNLESLVGILGGTVGMFTGFTFIGVSDFLVNKIFTLCK